MSSDLLKQKLPKEFVDAANAVVKIYQFQLREVIRYCDALKKVQQSLTYLCYDWDVYEKARSKDNNMSPEELAYLFTFNVILPIIVGEKIYCSVDYHQIITDANVSARVKERFLEYLKAYLKENNFQKLFTKEPDVPQIYDAFFPLSVSEYRDFDTKNIDILLDESTYTVSKNLRDNMLLALSGLRASHNLYRKILNIDKTFFFLYDTGGIVKKEDGRDKMLIPIGNGIEIEMVWSPAGTFTMGSPDGKSEFPKGSGEKPKKELGRWINETPHEVTLKKGFWIGQYPVTQAQYKAITGENPAEKDYGVGDNNPIYNVSWHDCVAFCEKLNQLKIAPSGYRFALPTEAQWEYACRAGTTTALNNGMSLTSRDGECPNLDEVGWYGQNSGGQTHPVMEKQPNTWGIYDMHGNEWEWCRDCCFWTIGKGIITDTYKDGIEDPLCKKGEYRVLRGGSWFNYAGGCRSAYRGSDDPGNRSYGYGFRLALVPEQKTAST